MSEPRVNPPSIDLLLSHPVSQDLVERHGRERVKDVFRQLTRELRTSAGTPLPPGKETLIESLALSARMRLESRRPAGPSAVLNATGILLHTNLGRAPLGAEAKDAVLRAAGFCTLEYDLATGQRGKRTEHVRPLMNELFLGANPRFDSLAVTNTAAALLLALDTLCNGKKAVVSRGELVAIGGDFRVPSIMAKSGATLLEAGTTNKTTLQDYREALEEGAGAVLKVHPSNYRIIGFTEEVGLSRLAALCKEYGVPLLYDAGTGLPPSAPSAVKRALLDVPSPSEALEEGASVVTFSADKTLGGPQSGILLGQVELIEKMTKNPLARALRPDKLVLAALAATLDAHLAGRHTQVPFFQMVAASATDLLARATSVSTALSSRGFVSTVVATESAAGGGSGVDAVLPSHAVTLSLPGLAASELAERLRRLTPPVIGRIQEGRVLLDMRSLLPEEDGLLLTALLGPGSSQTAD